MKNVMDVSEAQLAVVLGYARKDLRAARKKLGIEKDSTQEIRLYRDEVDAIAGELGISLSVAAEAFIEAQTLTDEGSTKKEAHAANGEAVLPVLARAKVANARLKNRRIIMANLEAANPVEIRVRVRDSKPFRPGMILPVRQVAGTFYEFAGRMPKSRRSYMEGRR